MRTDFLTGISVLISSERANRPYTYAKGSNKTPENNQKCPFCISNSDLLDSIIYCDDKQRVRIVKNKYPIIAESALNAFGIHDVLIDTPIHDEKFHDFTIEDIRIVFQSIKYRLLELKKVEKIRYIQVFKNEGRKAGASIYHSHLQIIALDFIPLIQRNIKKNFNKYFLKNNSCYLCDEIKKMQDYIFFENEEFICYIPYAPIYAYTINIAPKKHVSDFLDFNENSLNLLSVALKKVLFALRVIYEEVNYNFYFRNKIYNEENVDNHHFFVQIVPRTTNFAGFEFSTGCYTHSVEPILAAKKLKEILNEN